MHILDSTRTRGLPPSDRRAKIYSNRPLLASFFVAGFECAAHRRGDGVRLDLLASTAHARYAQQDYEAIRSHRLTSARDGLRWHLIEARPGCYRWDSWLQTLRAARSSRVQVIWDLCHYGWPDDLDVWSSEFVQRFARFAKAAARINCSESDEVPFYCPINEISYLAWAGGEQGLMNPRGIGRGAELKRQLVRAYLAAVDAIREVDRRARFMISEPLINVVGGGPVEQFAEAEQYRLSQFEVHDMISGVRDAELGGSTRCLDVIGANFYPDNQWYLNGCTIPFGHHAYRALSEMLVEAYERYSRPFLISETGAEGAMRPYWLHHVCAEVRRAIDHGVALEGVCLYPILDCHGWDNDRICRVGLFSVANSAGDRQIDSALSDELKMQQSLIFGARPVHARGRSP